MGNEFSGFVNNRDHQHKDYNQWKEEVNTSPVVAENNDVLVNRQAYNFFRFIAISFLLLFFLYGGFTAYAIYEGKFQTQINQSMNVNQNNSYSFNPTTNNNFQPPQFDIHLNQTIINVIVTNRSN